MRILRNVFIRVPNSLSDAGVPSFDFNSCRLASLEAVSKPSQSAAKHIARATSTFHRSSAINPRRSSRGSSRLNWFPLFYSEQNARSLHSRPIHVPPSAKSETRSGFQLMPGFASHPGESGLPAAQGSRPGNHPLTASRGLCVPSSELPGRVDSPNRRRWRPNACG